MIAIPTNNTRQNTEDFGKNVKKAWVGGDGFKMDVIKKVAKRFVKEGWFVYLIRGGMYANWTWLSVFNEPAHEGYVEEYNPCYYERVK